MYDIYTLYILWSYWVLTEFVYCCTASKTLKMLPLFNIIIIVKMCRLLCWHLLWPCACYVPMHTHKSAITEWSRLFACYSGSIAHIKVPIVDWYECSRCCLPDQCCQFSAVDYSDIRQSHSTHSERLICWSTSHIYGGFIAKIVTTKIYNSPNKIVQSKIRWISTWAYSARTLISSAFRDPSKYGTYFQFSRCLVHVVLLQTITCYYVPKLVIMGHYHILSGLLNIDQFLFMEPVFC